MNSRNHLGLFAKYWEPGRVKTRLAIDIGETAAAKVSFELFKFLVLRLGTVGNQRTIVYSPHDHQKEFSSIGGSNWQVRPQGSGDLGQRMRDFVEHLFATGEQPETVKLVLIGSDCPQISTDLIDEAFERLESYPVVLGPSVDGGYYLIGTTANYSEVFSRIDWSTERVFTQTVTRIEDLGLSYSLLKPLEDIDDLSGLNRFLQTVEQKFGQYSADVSLVDLRNRLKSILASVEPIS